MLRNIFFTFFFFTISQAFIDLNPNYFCGDLRPQPHIDIAQLTGLWFGKEMINHHIENYEEKIYEEKQRNNCPIIHISHDIEPSTTIHPLYKNYNYNYNYGEGPGYMTTNTPRTGEQKERTYRPLTEREIQRKLREKYEYDRRTTYGNYQDIQKQRFGYANPVRYFEVRYLRLIWDESGNSKEFHIRYNTSQPGFWISSGPEFGGASLDSQFNHLAGVIQVIKAVGNHMVLTFCHLLPKKELYTVVLSREIHLPEDDIHAVRSQLHRKSLSIRSTRKLCNSAYAVQLNTSLALILMFLHIFIFNNSSI